MSTPIAYSWTDTGAPQIISNDPQSFLNVLKQVLCFGYGSQPAAGWSIYSEDTSAHTLTLMQGVGGSSSGAPKYLQLSNPTFQSGSTIWWDNGAYFQVFAYEGMNGNVGINQFPPSNVKTSTWWFMMAHSASTTQANVVNTSYVQPWSIVADDRFFYIQMPAVYTLATGGSFYKMIYMFGDPVGMINDDNSCILYSHYSSSGGTGPRAYPACLGFVGQYNSVPAVIDQIMASSDPLISMNLPGNTNPGLYINRQLSGIFNPTTLGTQAIDGSSIVIPVFQSSFTTDAFTKRVVLSKIAIYEPGGVFRGYLPGAYLPSTDLFNYPVVTQNTQFTFNNVPFQFWHYTNNTSYGSGYNTNETVSLARAETTWTVGNSSTSGDSLRIFFRLDDWGR